MAYEFVVGETPAIATKRVLHERIACILEHLRDENAEDRDKSVHESRKAFKQIRAVLRLVRDEIGHDLYRQENIFYRDVSRTLAPLRDSFVRIGTMGKIAAANDDPDVRVLINKLKRRLRYRYKRTRLQMLEQSAVIAQAISAVEVAQARIDTLPIENEDFGAFGLGLRRIYRRGRKRMTVAYAAEPPSSELFHHWRKYAKYTWYADRLFKPYNPTALTPQIAELKELSDLIGDAHDIAVLYAWLQQAKDEFDDTWYHLFALIKDEEHQLLAQALPIGQAVFAEKPKTYVARIASYWDNPQLEESAHSTFTV